MFRQVNGSETTWGGESTLHGRTTSSVQRWLIQLLIISTLDSSQAVCLSMSKMWTFLYLLYPQPSAELKDPTHSFESGVLEQGNMENTQGGVP